jgi:hypothetical protein
MRLRRLDGYREPEQITDRSVIRFLEEYGLDGMVEHVKRLSQAAASMADQRARADRLARRLQQYERPAVAETMRSHRAGPESDG